MKKLLVVLALLALAALIEIPDDYTWTGIDQGFDVHVKSDTMYDWTLKYNPVSVSMDYQYPDKTSSGEKI